MGKNSFAVVGSGWRAEFYMRIAGRFGELFDLTGVLCRREERARELVSLYGVPATAREEDILRAVPDFVVVAVDRESGAREAERWTKMGFPVLLETPAGVDEEGLGRLWGLFEGGARISVAEQYFRYPLIASGLRAIDAGLIGEPDCVELSLVHDYHAWSLVRRMLGLGGGGRLPEFTIRAERAEFPVEETDSRYGPVREGRIRYSARVRAEVKFEGGKRAFYDFDGVQYHTFIRARHINVRGARGEWNDTVVRYVDDAHEPGMLRLRAEAVPGYGELVTPELRRLSERWNPFVHMETEQDEYAIATLLLDMGRYLRGGGEPYPMREALEDAYMWLLTQRAIDAGAAVSSGPRPWNR